MQELFVYIHWPFCKSLCPYCDFNSFIYSYEDRKIFASSYEKEILHYSEKIAKTHKVKTIFFGGGTPSLMEKHEVLSIISLIKNNFICDDDIEITLEANPSSFEAEKFSDFKDAGVNRVSIGIQSFDDFFLKQIGRTHSSIDAENAVKSACKIFKNVSFDLMFGLPKQTVADLNRDFDFALNSFSQSHISAYNLTIEKGTDFFAMAKNNQLSLPNTEILEEMYDIVGKKMENFGFNRYEVSNYAKNGFECRHNLGYWQVKDYIGIGAGAHGRVFIDGRRFETMNHHKPSKWSEIVQKNGIGTQKFEEITHENQVYEILLMSLRTKLGIDIKDIKNRLKIDIFDNIDTEKLDFLIKNNLLLMENDKIYPSDDGLKMVNYIVKHLIKN
ncbi:radical SAM family heme chaperone HemW [Candidatus Deianiraea vastatrix]|uniref:Heme chaperone HemW n=1 Tax=Candidatus Deianiraea vastatrix TaxID=2163644 RepID=A0A5B8XHY8_9RICK|nr:radical SAM family heme chaperone HemW [Candidatus Deianiraea vastatrix]QED23377.1 HemN coproporphyrinogen-III oxidase/dehydrogenase [Candidatus Deianiraea vastatrix]